MANERLENLEAIYEMAKKLELRDLDKTRVYVASLLTMGDPAETKKLIDNFNKEDFDKKGA